jgi:hypothetical protein
MKREQEKKEIEDMESRRDTSSTIEFTEYAPLDQDYTKKELAEIYKKIITDINSGKR